MPTCLAADVIIALKRDPIVAGPDISNCSINQLASNYRTSYDTVHWLLIKIFCLVSSCVIALASCRRLQSNWFFVAERRPGFKTSSLLLLDSDSLLASSLLSLSSFPCENWTFRPRFWCDFSFLLSNFDGGVGLRL
jgi:hypothetical protein